MSNNESTPRHARPIALNGIDGPVLPDAKANRKAHLYPVLRKMAWFAVKTLVVVVAAAAGGGLAAASENGNNVFFRDQALCIRTSNDPRNEVAVARDYAILTGDPYYEADGSVQTSVLTGGLAQQARPLGDPVLCEKRQVGWLQSLARIPGDPYISDGFPAGRVVSPAEQQIVVIDTRAKS